MGASPVLTGSAATSPSRGAVPHTGSSSASPLLEPGAAARCHLTPAQQAQVSRLETLGRVASAVCPSDEALERLCAEAIRRVVFAAVGVALLDLYGPLVADKDLLLDNVYSDLWGVTCTQLRIDRPVCVDAVPAPPPLLPPLSAPGPVWLRPFQRAINVLSELPRCPSPDGKRDVLLAAMGNAFRCVQDPVR